MSGRKLSETRCRILRCLATWDSKANGHPTARQIAEACGEHRRASDWAHGPLREMSYGYGRPALVESAGWQRAITAGTWRITDAGREALVATGPPA